MCGRQGFAPFYAGGKHVAAFAANGPFRTCSLALAAAVR